VEAVLGGLRLQAVGSLVVAVTGAAGVVTITTPEGSTWAAPRDRAVRLADGHTLALGLPEAGLRSYVAVRGGLDLAPTLGSRSPDTLAALGPDPLRAGTLLPVGRPPGTAVSPWPDPVADREDGPVTLRAITGPRESWFTPQARTSFLTQVWTVTDDADRVGVRLAGEPLTRATAGELPSEGTVAGAVQVTASGQPVVFLADHPVSGGYPVIAVVREDDLGRAAQLRPGDQVRFAVSRAEGPVRAG
jgi:biotin-dependent carboxylase-like uncharacterized protein